jgi:hypothetical protein
MVLEHHELNYDRTSLQGSCYPSDYYKKHDDGGDRPFVTNNLPIPAFVAGMLIERLLERNTFKWPLL